MEVSALPCVHFYMKENCALCDDIKAQLWLLQQYYDFEIEERDIYTCDEWLMEYQLSIPVVELNGNQLDCESASYQTIEKLLKEKT
ncbi:MAG TPA: glutaredoxin family protein [Bacillota bacterium]|nr:glutaredoxin family protein [Bacillota bacterium]